PFAPRRQRTIAIVKSQPASNLPAVVVNERQLRDITHDALQAVIAANKPPMLFQRGGILTRLKVDPDNDAALLEPLSESAVCGHLARVADWFRERHTAAGVACQSTCPPVVVVRDVISLPNWDV